MYRIELGRWNLEKHEYLWLIGEYYITEIEINSSYQLLINGIEFRLTGS